MDSSLAPRTPGWCRARTFSRLPAANIADPLRVGGMALVVHPSGRRVGPSTSIYGEPLIIAGARSAQPRVSARPGGAP